MEATIKQVLLLYIVCVCVTLMKAQDYEVIPDKEQDKKCPSVCPRNIVPVCAVKPGGKPTSFLNYCNYRSEKYCYTSGSTYQHIANSYCGDEE